MAIKVVTAKAHQSYLDNAQIQKEVLSIQDQLNKVDLAYKENTINFVFLKGMYNHQDRKMLTACLFVNKMDKPITRLHGVLRLGFKEKDAEIAKATLDFDEEFLGVLNPDEALFVHIGIPVKGLSKDEDFTISAINGTFDEVGVVTN